MHQLYAKNYTMASRLLVRGANVNYVNSNGLTALHVFVDNQMTEAIKYLLQKGANPHIMDLTGEDCCEKAKRMGFALDFKELNECSFVKKIIPMLPNKQNPLIENLPFYFKQREKLIKDKLEALKHAQKDSSQYDKIISDLKKVSVVRLQGTGDTT